MEKRSKARKGSSRQSKVLKSRKSPKLSKEQSDIDVSEGDRRDRELRGRQLKDFSDKNSAEWAIHRERRRWNLCERKTYFRKIVFDICDIVCYAGFERANNRSPCASVIFLRGELLKDRLSISDRFDDCGVELINAILLAEVPPTHERLFWNLNQLLRAASDLTSLAPGGFIGADSFAFYLKDLIMARQEELDFTLEWAYLTQSDIDDVVSLLKSGDSALINWRKFLLSVSGVRTPTVEELLDLRKKILEFNRETMSRKAFNKLQLWFEGDLEKDIEDPDDLFWTKFRLKNFIFKIYGTKYSEMSLSNMLLELCPSGNIFESFLRTASVLSGERFASPEESKRFRRLQRTHRKNFRKFFPEFIKDLVDLSVPKEETVSEEEAVLEKEISFSKDSKTSSSEENTQKVPCKPSQTTIDRMISSGKRFSIPRSIVVRTLMVASLNCEAYKKLKIVLGKIIEEQKIDLLPHDPQDTIQVHRLAESSEFMKMLLQFGQFLRPNMTKQVYEKVQNYKTSL